MKAICDFCGREVNNPLIDTDSRNRLYFFCNQKHRDKYEKTIEILYVTSPYFWIPGSAIAWLFRRAYEKIKHKKSFEEEMMEYFEENIAEKRMEINIGKAL